MHIYDAGILTLRLRYFVKTYRMEVCRFLALLVILVSLAYLVKGAHLVENDDTSCDYPALYNFGDSNSDTGGGSAAFFPMAKPTGQTYFHRPSGRGSDGRLIIDFIADHLGLPYLSPYLDTIATNYSHGANFAIGGATIMRPKELWFDTGVSPFNLEIQVEHYTQIKDRSSYFYKEAKGEDSVVSRLPQPEDFPKALYTFDIGQNDVAYGIRRLSIENQTRAAPDVVKEFIKQVRVLYQRGARTFWIHNTGPIGCIPVAVVKIANPVPSDFDGHGCNKIQNGITVEFNKQLKSEVTKLRTELSDATIVLVDMYRAKIDLIDNAKNQGFGDPFGICCGYHGVGYEIWCGNTGKVNGSEVYADSCPKPGGLISWDGVHYTEAANHWIANRIVNGSYSDPPIPITKACHRQI